MAVSIKCIGIIFISANFSRGTLHFVGICYGFKALDQVESPNTAFTIFRTRFEEGKLK